MDTLEIYISGWKAGKNANLTLLPNEVLPAPEHLSEAEAAEWREGWADGWRETEEGW